MRPSVARSPGRRWRSHDMHARAWRFAAIFAILAVVLAACTSSTSSSAPSASSAAVASAPAESSVAPSAEASAPAASEVASGAPSPVITPLPNNTSQAAPGDIVIRWYCCLGTGDAPDTGRGRAEGRRRLQRGEPRHPPAVRRLRVCLGSRRPIGPARVRQRPRHRRPAWDRRSERLPQPVAGPAAAHRQEQVRHEPVSRRRPSISTTSVGRARSASRTRSIPRCCSTSRACSRRPAWPSRRTPGTATTRCPTARRCRGTGTRSRSWPRS